MATGMLAPSLRSYNANLMEIYRRLGLSYPPAKANVLKDMIRDLKELTYFSTFYSAGDSIQTGAVVQPPLHSVLGRHDDFRILGRVCD